MPGGPELSEKVPDEKFQLVESFMRFVREQKAHRDQALDVAPILEMERETDAFMLARQRVSVYCDANKQLMEQVENDTNKLLRHAELEYSLLRPYLANNISSHQQPQQQLDQFVNFGSTNRNTTPQANNPFPSRDPSHAEQSSHLPLRSRNSQLNNGHDYTSKQTAGRNHFANTSSSQYFSHLAGQFDSRMRACGDQIEELKMSPDRMAKTQNADELFKWLKKQHETLGQIAAKVYMTHDRIMDKESELEQTSMARARDSLSNGIRSNTSRSVAQQ